MAASLVERAIAVAGPARNRAAPGGWQNRIVTTTPEAAQTQTAPVRTAAREAAGAAVVAVSRSATHGFRKPQAPSIVLVAGWGVEGDAHAGATAQHLYVVKKDPTRANLTQVHLIQQELFAELAGRYDVGPGDLGENITTAGVDLLSLPLGTRLHLGGSAVVEVTGLRSPCSKINRFQSGLMKALLGKDDDGAVVRKSGIMGVVVEGGTVSPGDGLRVELPEGDHVALGVV
jgi:MOSC domain-containing protein YiiM